MSDVPYDNSKLCLRIYPHQPFIAPENYNLFLNGSLNWTHMHSSSPALASVESFE